MNNYFICRGNIGLRSILPQDRDDFLRWHNDAALRQQIGGIFPFTENTFKEICQSKNEDHPSSVWMALCLEDRLIGIAGFHNIKYICRNVEFALLIGKSEFRNKGIGHTALLMMEEYAFNQLGMHRLYARIYSDNQGSLRFLKNHNWNKEGILTDDFFRNGQFTDVIIMAKINEL